MFIEIIHDANGNIEHCWQADTLPEGGVDVPMVSVKGGLPTGLEQVRINVDTITELQVIAVAISAKVGIAEYIRDKFDVDLDMTISLPSQVKLPSGMKMRALKMKKKGV